MAKKESKLKLAQEKAQKSIDKVNNRIELLGEKTAVLYDTLDEIQTLFDRIRNVPTKQRIQYTNLKTIRLNWKRHAEKIEKDYNELTAKGAGAGVAGAGLGVAVATLGPTAAMGFATTFGVASTGTAIATLHGAAATNAALAWLGGGALSIGGGGMAAGEAFLALAGPVGWAISGIALLSGGLVIWKTKADKNRIENIFTLISERDAKSYDLAVVEINERIARIFDENKKLKKGIDIIKTFGTDYSAMDESQQYELGAYVNLMQSSTQLLINPILGLQPKYTSYDFRMFCMRNKKMDIFNDPIQTNAIVFLANFLYKIDLDSKDRKVLWKSLKNNKNLLESLGIEKKGFNLSLLELVNEVLEYKYNS